MMTLDEMKQAVCGKLPEMVLMLQTCTYMGVPIWKRFVMKRKSGEFVNIHWPTEGLKICREAEKLLTEQEMCDYSVKLHNIACPIKCSSPTCAYAITATWEQRLEALCRVWWPKRFQ